MYRRPRTSIAAAVGAAALIAGLVTPQAFAADPDPDPVPSSVPGDDTAAPKLVTGLNEAAAGGAPEDAARAYLAANSGRFQVSSDPQKLKTVRTEGSAATNAAAKATGAEDSTVRFQQFHQGVEVFGAQYLVHFAGQGADRKVTGVGGSYFTRLSVPVAETVPGAVSRGWALSTVKDPLERGKAAVDDHGLIVLPGGAGRLTRHFTVRSGDVLREVYVDARTGGVAMQFSKEQRGETPAAGTGPDVHGVVQDIDVAKQDDGTYKMTDLTRGSRVETYDAEKRSYSLYLGQMPAGAQPLASPAAAFPASAGETGAVNAHLNAAEVYDFYRTRFNRDGLDGKGGTIRSVVNVTSGGRPFLNAFWDGEKMVYGGGGPGYYSFAASLDVAGHEMTHGVITNSADLAYTNQPGALNEAVADYFGNAVQVQVQGVPMSSPDAGLIGEELCRTGTPRDCALRDLNDGRSAVKDYLGVPVGTDNGGVHLNSTIFSGALWDIRETLDPLTADKVVYKALTQYMTPVTGFSDGRDAVLAAGKAAGLKRADLRKIANAFDKHGIYRGWEKHLGMDSRTLLGNVTNMYSQPSAERGRYVISNSDATGLDLPAIYTGRTDGGRADGGRAKQLSPDDNRWHEFPATDGRNAAWLAMGTGLNGDYGMEILTGSLNGGAQRSLFRSDTEQPGEVRIDGDYVAFLTVDYTVGKDYLYLSYKGAPAARVDLGEGHGAWGLSVKDGKMAWTEYWETPEGGALFVPTVMDLKSGKITARFAPADTTGLNAPLSGDTLLAGDRVVWTERMRSAASKTAIRSAKLDGTDVRDVVSATASYAPGGTLITASDRYLTFLSQPDSDEWSNANLPKLWQIPLDHGPRAEPVRMSCDRGTQIYADADTGPDGRDQRQVLWLDATGGQTDLVVRNSPTNRRC